MFGKERSLAWGSFCGGGMRGGRATGEIMVGGKFLRIRSRCIDLFHDRRYRGVLFPSSNIETIAYTSESIRSQQTKVLTSIPPTISPTYAGLPIKIHTPGPFCCRGTPRTPAHEFTSQHRQNNKHKNQCPNIYNSLRWKSNSLARTRISHVSYTAQGAPIYLKSYPTFQMGQILMNHVETTPNRDFPRNFQPRGRATLGVLGCTHDGGGTKLLFKIWVEGIVLNPFSTKWKEFLMVNSNISVIGTKGRSRAYLSPHVASRNREAPPETLPSHGCVANTTFG